MRSAPGIRRAAGNRCWGSGLIAMDIVSTDEGDFAATGGSCGNVMSILAWLGWKATPVARFGSDLAGEFLREELRQTRIDLRCLSVESTIQTPIVIQRFVTDRDGGRVHRFSLTCPECGAWLPRHRPITLQQAEALRSSRQQPKTFYFDRVSPGALRLAEIARDKGALIVFEPQSIGDESKFQRAVDACHVLKYSNDRLGQVPDLSVAASPKLVVETRGNEGLRFRWRGRWTQLDAFKVDDPVDAAGSGDWCTAALINGIGADGAAGLTAQRKESLIAVLQTGQALAAINCQYFGARGAMVAINLQQLNRRLKRLGTSPNVRTLNEDSAYALEAKPPEYCRSCDPSINNDSVMPNKRRA